MKRGNGGERRNGKRRSRTLSVGQKISLPGCRRGEAFPQAAFDAVAGRLAHSRRELMGETLGQGDCIQLGQNPRHCLIRAQLRKNRLKQRKSL